MLQLQHMEKAHLEKNSRELEMTQSFSLALLDPTALLELRDDGNCEFILPEIVYDMVYPGQYKRIIKSVRLTIPCVTGPYTSIGATLSLASSQLRREASNNPSVESLPSVPLQQANSSIATSTAVNDGGVFELNFRDERYLPFEGAGAISEWNLGLPEQIRQFDYDTISDVIIHVSYTALYSKTFKGTVEGLIVERLNANGLFRMFSLRYEFSDAFHRLLAATELPQTCYIEIGSQHFPAFLGGHDPEMTEVTVFVNSKADDPINLDALSIKGKAFDEFDEEPNSFEDELMQKGAVSLTGDPLGTWSITNDLGTFLKDELEDIIIVVKYTMNS